MLPHFSHQVYKTAVEGLIKNTMDGFNSTCLAYGQTGSGKTFTMGTSHTEVADTPPESLGMIPRTVHGIFDRIEACKRADPHYTAVLTVSYVELYQEEFKDLLNPEVSHRLIHLREDAHGQIAVDGLRRESASSREEVLALLEKGARERTTAHTCMNDTSSRSHAIFTVQLEQSVPVQDKDIKNKDTNGQGQGAGKDGAGDEVDGGDDSLLTVSAADQTAEQEVFISSLGALPAPLAGGVVLDSEERRAFMTR